jgi:hypothetical protein
MGKRQLLFKGNNAKRRKASPSPSISIPRKMKKAAPPCQRMPLPLETTD